MTKETDTDYCIISEDVEQHAPLVFNAIQEYYSRLENLVNALGGDSDVREIIHSNTNVFNILPNKKLKFDKIFLEDDDFRISVIFHLGISNTVGTFLSWEAFVSMRNIFESAFMTVSQDSLSIDSIMLKSFNVDPRALPKSYLTKTMRLDEFNMAVELIVKKLSSLKRYEEFSNYDDYFEYMETECGKIVEICNSSGYYGTHEIERFTCACIANKMRLPSMDLLYKVEGVNSRFNVTVENIKEVQEQILSTIFE